MKHNPRLHISDCLCRPSPASHVIPPKLCKTCTGEVGETRRSRSRFVASNPLDTALNYLTCYSVDRVRCNFPFSRENTLLPSSSCMQLIHMISCSTPRTSSQGCLGAGLKAHVLSNHGSSELKHDIAPTTSIHSKSLFEFESVLLAVLRASESCMPRDV